MINELTKFKVKLNSLTSLNVKILTEPSNGSNSQSPDIEEPKQRSSKVQKQLRQLKRSRDRSRSLTEKPKSRKTKPWVDEAILNRTGSVPPRSAASTSCVPCHCPECLPCREDCCENPAVRSGRCCDPRTLGQCLQPFEVIFLTNSSFPSITIT